jgi:hypothetical protein
MHSFLVMAIQGFTKIFDKALSMSLILQTLNLSAIALLLQNSSKPTP